LVENHPYHELVTPEPVFVPAPLQKRKRNRRPSERKYS
jgi:hypothetical protein